MSHKVITFSGRTEDVQPTLDALNEKGIEIIEFIQETTYFQTVMPYVAVTGYMIYKEIESGESIESN